MSFCPSCGAQPPSGARFCEQCGTSLGTPPAGLPPPADPDDILVITFDDSPPITAPADQPAPPGASAPTPDRPAQGRRAVVLVAVLGTLVLVGIGLTLFRTLGDGPAAQMGARNEVQRQLNKYRSQGSYKKAVAAHAGALRDEGIEILGEDADALRRAADAMAQRLDLSPCTYLAANQIETAYDNRLTVSSIATELSPLSGAIGCSYYADLGAGGEVAVASITVSSPDFYESLRSRAPESWSQAPFDSSVLVQDFGGPEFSVYHIPYGGVWVHTMSCGWGNFIPVGLTEEQCALAAERLTVLVSSMLETDSE